MTRSTFRSAAVLVAILMLLAFVGGARAQSVYTGRLLVGSPHEVTNEATGPILFGDDACQDPEAEGFHSNCIQLAPTDAGLPLVSFDFIPFASSGTGIDSPCVYSPAFHFYDAAGARLAFDEHFVPEGAADLAVTFFTTTCVDLQWTLVLGFE